MMVEERQRLAGLVAMEGCIELTYWNRSINQAEHRGNNVSIVTLKAYI